MINKEVMQHDPKAKAYLEAIEDYTQAFNTFQALRIYGIAEDNATFIHARHALAKSFETLIAHAFPQYVS